MAPRSSSRGPILCAVLSAEALGPNPADAALALFDAGVDWIQLRDRSLETSALLRVACALTGARDLARSQAKNACVVVNRRIDIALSTGTDGVHFGFDALDPATATALLPESALLGVSLHSVQEVESLAKKVLAHPQLYAHLYAHLAPIWDPMSKPASRPALGPDLLARACGLGPRILAQGGLDPVRAAQAIRAGAAGIAVTGILANSGDPITAARRLREALDRQNQPRG
jgi:thiamine-phosphate pyrophosphorylase